MSRQTPRALTELLNREWPIAPASHENRPASLAVRGESLPACGLRQPAVWIPRDVVPLPLVGAVVEVKFPAVALPLPGGHARARADDFQLHFWRARVVAHQETPPARFPDGATRSQGRRSFVPLRLAPGY